MIVLTAVLTLPLLSERHAHHLSKHSSYNKLVLITITLSCTATWIWHLTHIKIRTYEAGEMVQGLRALATLPVSQVQFPANI